MVATTAPACHPPTECGVGPPTCAASSPSLLSHLPHIRSPSPPSRKLLPPNPPPSHEPHPVSTPSLELAGAGPRRARPTTNAESGGDGSVQWLLLRPRPARGEGRGLRGSPRRWRQGQRLRAFSSPLPLLLPQPPPPTVGSNNGSGCCDNGGGSGDGGSAPVTMAVTVVATATSPAAPVAVLVGKGPPMCTAAAGTRGGAHSTVPAAWPCAGARMGKGRRPFQPPAEAAGDGGWRRLCRGVRGVTHRPSLCGRDGCARRGLCGRREELEGVE